MNLSVQPEKLLELIKKFSNKIRIIPFYFEFDENKSKINKQKHGIDFEEAKFLWNDDKMVEINRAYEILKEYIENYKFSFSEEEILKQFPQIHHADKFRFQGIMAKFKNRAKNEKLAKIFEEIREIIAKNGQQIGV